MSEFQGEAIKGHGSMTVDEVIEEVISKSSIVETVEFDEGNIEEATVAKEQGNAFFRDKDYDAAIDSYSRAIHLCPKSEEFKETLVYLFQHLEFSKSVMHWELMTTSRFAGDILW